MSNMWEHREEKPFGCLGCLSFVFFLVVVPLMIIAKHI
jgi:hypothetical protein